MSGIAGAQTQYATDPFDPPRLDAAVAQHVLHLQVGDHDIAMRVAITQREIADEAMTEHAAFRAQLDPLGDIEATIGEHAHVDVVTEDPLLRPRRQREAGEQQERAPHQRVNSTGTGCRLPSSAWKKPAWPIPVSRATNVSGRRCTASLRSRTAPL